jgi:cardiolipin synthase
MLDPIADKAMVIIALMVVCVLFGMQFSIILPATLILFREVFVSGLREFLGNTAGLLKVTKLAKWKTTAQMVSIVVLFSYGIFSHYVGMGTFGMDGVTFDGIINGEIEDVNGLVWKARAMEASYYGGIILLWIASALTVITGADYMRKAMPFLREEPEQ